MIERYLKSFSILRTDTSRSRWTLATNYRASHKPLLLLAVIDLVAQGIIKTNFIEFTPDLGELFNIYWSRVMPPDQRSNIILPFYHLNSDIYLDHNATTPVDKRVLKKMLPYFFEVYWLKR